MKNNEVLITGPMYGPTITQLDETFTTYKLYQTKDRDGLIAELAPRLRAIAHGGHDSIGDALLARLPNVQLIANFGVGYDSIDVKAASARGVKVTNTPDVLTDEVADLAIGLLLATARRMVAADKYVRAGRWAKEGNFPFTTRVHGKKLGIVGLGRIGMAIARRAEGFGMTILYHNRNARTDVSYRFCPDLIAMAREADFLMVVTPGGAGTAKLIDAKVMDAIGPNGTLINISRGSVVDEEALIKALADGRLGAAGLDVFAHEPHVPEALFAFDNVVLQPHQASATPETRAAMGQLVVDNLKALFAGQPLLTPVN
jgi:lactate dehydrogenase-like 2-hydroxyacid dehydrogenase